MRRLIYSRFGWKRTRLSRLSEDELKEIKDFIEECFSKKEVWTVFELLKELKNRFNLHIKGMQLGILFRRINLFQNLERQRIEHCKHGNKYFYTLYRWKKEEVLQEITSQSSEDEADDKILKLEQKTNERVKSKTKYYCNPECKEKCNDRRDKDRRCFSGEHCSQKAIKVKEWRGAYKFIKI